MYIVNRFYSYIIHTILYIDTQNLYISIGIKINFDMKSTNINYKLQISIQIIYITKIYGKKFKCFRIFPLSDINKS